MSRCPMNEKRERLEINFFVMSFCAVFLWNSLIILSFYFLICILNFISEFTIHVKVNSITLYQIREKLSRHDVRAQMVFCMLHLFQLEDSDVEEGTYIPLTRPEAFNPPSLVHMQIQDEQSDEASHETTGSDSDEEPRRRPKRTKLRPRRPQPQGQTDKKEKYNVWCKALQVCFEDAKTFLHRKFVQYANLTP